MARVAMLKASELRARILKLQAPYERLARARPDNADVLKALAVQLVLWADRRRRDLRRAWRLTHSAMALAPARADLHALEGRILDDLGQPEAAVPCFRRAVELAPNDRDYANYLLRLLAHSAGREEFARLLEATARRHRIDLSITRRELERKGMPAEAATVYQNAFPVAYNFFTSRLWDEAEAFERRHLAARHRRGKRNELKHALASRRANRVSRTRLPVELRPLAPLAQKWGIGDDGDRGFLLNRMTEAERRTLRRALPVAIRRRIDAWLDGFPDAGQMPREAAAFMYLLEAYEEVPSRRSRPRAPRPRRSRPRSARG